MYISPLFGLLRSGFFCYNRRIPLYRHSHGHNRRAEVDAYGNIIIPGSEPIISTPVPKAPAVWQVTEDDEVVQSVRKKRTKNVSCEQVVSILKTVRGTMIQTTSSLVEEGQRQYIVSFSSVLSGMRAIPGLCGRTMQYAGQFLTQPV
ncbi:hypothetical protein FJZ28_04300, partial [Candidatus Peregrinibacteria bacterium]|nr:hypothetical protein [Candidatus Peregrinibacteria bacterium]